MLVLVEVLGLVVLLLSLLVLVLGVVIAKRITRPGVHTYWDDYTFVPSDMDVPFERVEFSAPDGLRLVGWLMERPPGAGTVIMASGYRDRKTSLLPVAAGVWKRGLSVFLFDFRNQGESERDTAQTMGFREVKDMQAAISLMLQRSPDSRIGLMGWSMAGVVSILAASGDPRITAIVTDAAYADQSDIITHIVRQTAPVPRFPVVAPVTDLICQAMAGYRPTQVRPEDHIAGIGDRPIFIIHGEDDDLCPVEHAQRLYSRAGAGRRLWIVPKAKHVGAYFAAPAFYIETIAGFFQEHLSLQPAREDVSSTVQAPANNEEATRNGPYAT